MGTTTGTGGGSTSFGGSSVGSNGGSSFGAGGSFGASGASPSAGGTPGASGSTGTPSGAGGFSPGVGGMDSMGGAGDPPVGMGGDSSMGSGGAPMSAGGASMGSGGASMGSAGKASMGDGECCSDGDCLCHGDPPNSLNDSRGPFRPATQRMSAGTAHYPSDAEPPFAGVAICPGFLNSGPEMAAWGTFYASWGIVTVVTNTLPTDFPDIRGRKLLAAIEELKRLNSGGSGPLSGKMSGRYGTSGYSMGGGGTTLATRSDKTLLSSVGLAAWGPNGSGIQTPTLLFCGETDGVAPCSQSQGAYRSIPESTPKMIISIPLTGHLAWFGPNDTSGGWGLGFQKVFLEGDERWKPLLMQKPRSGSYTTNIR